MTQGPVTSAPSGSDSRPLEPGSSDSATELPRGPSGPHDSDDPLPPHASEHLLSTSVNRLNRLRAAVLGCNDGLTSTAGLVVGVAAASASTTALAYAGVAGLVAGSLSMGGGEFTSVQAQRDSQDALLRHQRQELELMPNEELDELAHLYVERGLSVGLARAVAAELTAKDALAAHAEAELGIDLTDLISPWQASVASAAAYLLGGVVALLAILIPPADIRVGLCALVVLLGLAATGYVAAHVGSAPRGRGTLRNVIVGGLTMSITYGLGLAVHAALR